nr:hypothetical protein [Maliibacterium massiliense]
MARCTSKTGEAFCVPASDVTCAQGVCRGDCIDKLGRFEDFCAHLAAEQETITARLEGLRQAGKERSVQFRELLAKKLTDANIMAMLRARDLL